MTILNSKDVVFVVESWNNVKGCKLPFPRFMANRRNSQKSKDIYIYRQNLSRGSEASSTGYWLP